MKTVPLNPATADPRVMKILTIADFILVPCALSLQICEAIRNYLFYPRQKQQKTYFYRAFWSLQKEGKRTRQAK